ncbi:MAG: hypothetical protein AAFY21_16975 [Cyanobacteria bacterium J06641_2]
MGQAEGQAEHPVRKVFRDIVPRRTGHMGHSGQTMTEEFFRCSATCPWDYLSFDW